MGDLSDDDLMLLVQSGHAHAFEVLIRRHQSYVLGLASRFLADAAVGRDIAQEVFLSIWSNASHYEARGRFRSYLLSMTLKRCQHLGRAHRSQLRKRESQVLHQEGDSAAQGTPLEALIERERARAVRERLAELPEKARAVVILRFTNGLSLAEIAEVTGAPAGTVKSHLFRALRQLQRLLGKEVP
jgi:RNA polymerase sigma-70 factor (ECF subfamily)